MNIQELLTIMARLRDPKTGCPWDVEQDFASIAPHTIEEAYEVADAIQRQDYHGLKDELGDLLLQVVFHAQMAKESELFSFEDVVGAICDKLVRRHPHVFGDAKIHTAEEQTEAWEILKRQERAGKSKSLMDDVTLGLPALTRALKLQKRAATVGFDWKDKKDVLAKFEEEWGEFQEAISDPEKASEEFGDLLFVMCNLARHLKIDPEESLRKTNAKFVRRFQHIEKQLAAKGRIPEQATLDEMEELWVEAKRLEKT